MIGELRANGTLKPRDKKSILRQRIVEEYNRGTTDKYELGKIFGISADTAQRYVSKAMGEWQRPSRNYKKRQVNDKAIAIMEELEKGEKSLVQVARDFGVSRQYAHQLKKRLESE